MDMFSNTLPMFSSSGLGIQGVGEGHGSTPSAHGGGLGGLVNGLFQTIMGEDGSTTGQTGVATTQLGEFDPEQFVESTLREARGSDSTGLSQNIGGLMKLIGGLL